MSSQSVTRTGLIQSFRKYFPCMSTQDRHFRIVALSAYLGFRYVDFLIGSRWIGTEWRYGMYLSSLKKNLRNSTASLPPLASLNIIHGSQSSCAAGVLPEGPTILSATATWSGAAISLGAYFSM